MTTRFEDLPPVSHAPVSTSTRVLSALTAIFNGLLAGAIVATIGWATLPFIRWTFTHGSTAIEASAPAPESSSNLVGWLMWFTVLGLALVTAVTVSGRSFAKQIHSAQLDVHVNTYREVITEHMREKSGRRIR